MPARDVLLALVPIVVLFACGSGAASAPNSASAFVGTWTCSGSVSESVTSPPSTPGSISSVAEVVTFVANPDGTITATSNSEDAGDSFGNCSSTTFSVSGSTATAVSLQTCSIAGVSYVFATETFVVSGSSATSTFSGSVSQGGADGGVVMSTGTVVVSATCTAS